MKSLESSNLHDKGPQYDEYLVNLWRHYDFDGNPPPLNSDAERRLKEKCERYSTFVINSHRQNKGIDQISPESNRRQLHNEIAIMTVGKQRSGMDIGDARLIASFALEYTQGLTMDDLESGKFDDQFN